jgi:hypothetical protein
MRKYAILDIHKILQSEQYTKSKDIQRDKQSNELTWGSTKLVQHFHL